VSGFGAFREIQLYSSLWGEFRPSGDLDVKKNRQGALGAVPLYDVGRLLDEHLRFLKAEAAVFFGQIKPGEKFRFHGETHPRLLMRVEMASNVKNKNGVPDLFNAVVLTGKTPGQTLLVDDHARVVKEKE